MELWRNFAVDDDSTGDYTVLWTKGNIYTQFRAEPGYGPNTKRAGYQF